MSQKFRIKNDKGLFVDVRPAGLVSVAMAKGLRETILPTVEEAYRERCEKALDLLQALPVFEHHSAIGRFDPMFDKKTDEDYKRERKVKNWIQRPAARMAMHGWQMPQVAKGASSGEGIEIHNAETAGWTKIDKVVEHMGWIDHMLVLAGMDKVSPYSYTGSKTAAKKAKDLRFEPIDDFAELAGAETWMLFMGGGPRGGAGGFMDDKGGRGPLARARMFESPKAAAKTASARGLSYWKVVKGSIELSGLETFPGDSVDDKLAHAIALRENDNLKKALEGASMDDLKARLAELEAKLGEGVAPELAKPARSSRL